jgi:hypothetical protein
MDDNGKSHTICAWSMEEKQEHVIFAWSMEEAAPVLVEEVCEQHHTNSLHPPWFPVFPAGKKRMTLFHHVLRDVHFLIA